VRVANQTKIKHTMWPLLTVPLMYVSLILLLRAEERTPRDVQSVKTFKPLCTLLVILTCALSFSRPAAAFDPRYTVLILIGLTFSLAGDILLIPYDNPKAFLAGLVAFLMAHVAYIIAFIYLQFGILDEINVAGELVTAIVLLIIGANVYRYLAPGLGDMRMPVIAYIIVISFMVFCAVGIALVHPGPAMQPALIATGASLFYVSDAILAANKFRMGGNMPHYKVWNLSAYYSGQLLIALSASFFP
jgi:uncharacterized membrane protein YhhN